MSVPRSIFEQVKKLIPPLDGTLHKGQSGQWLHEDEGYSVIH